MPKPKGGKVKAFDIRFYMRKVERLNDELYNVEFKTYPAVKDPAH